MFTKILIVIVLSIYVSSDETNKIQKAKDGWWEEFQQGFQDYYEQSKKTFEDSLNEVKRRTLYAIEVGKEKFSELKVKYDEIQADNKTLSDQKKLWEDRLQKLKDQSIDVINSLNEKYEKLKQTTLNAIQNQREQWQTKIKELSEDIRKINETETTDK